MVRITDSFSMMLAVDHGTDDHGAIDRGTVWLG